MSIAKELIEESWDFAQQNPEHKEAAARLVRSVVSIDRKYEGQARDRLLAQAQSSFRKQIQNAQAEAQTRELLAELKQNQQRIAKALEQITGAQPPALAKTTPRLHADGAMMH